VNDDASGPPLSALLSLNAPSLNSVAVEGLGYGDWRLSQRANRKDSPGQPQR
jgi:hypothetical protein